MYINTLANRYLVHGRFHPVISTMYCLVQHS